MGNRHDLRPHQHTGPGDGGTIELGLGWTLDGRMDDLGSSLSYAMDAEAAFVQVFWTITHDGASSFPLCLQVNGKTSGYTTYHPDGSTGAESDRFDALSNVLANNTPLYGKFLLHPSETQLGIVNQAADHDGTGVRGFLGTGGGPEKITSFEFVSGQSSTDPLNVDAGEAVVYRRGV